MKTENRAATLAAFIEWSQDRIPESVTRGVIRAMGGWAHWLESAPDVSRHGAHTGWAGFTYYADTVPFALRHRADIRKMLAEQASDFGTDIIPMIKGFGRADGKRALDSDANAWKLNPDWIPLGGFMPRLMAEGIAMDVPVLISVGGKSHGVCQVVQFGELVAAYEMAANWSRADNG